MPKDPQSELGLRPGVPVCYVLNTESLSDLLVLEQACQQYHLPSPRHTVASLQTPGATSFLCLQKLGLLQVERGMSMEPPTALTELLDAVNADPEADVLLVPVSVMWGRNPGREERSIMKLLFFDDERAGVLQKLFIVVAQGRTNYLQFAKPISLRQFAYDNRGLEGQAKKLRRVLRVHFRLQRNTAMGPSLSHRSQVVASLMETKAVKSAILDEARKLKLPLERAEARARGYIWEIACDQNYPMIKLADIFLSWLWNRLYNGVTIKHAERLREIDKTHEIVYLPAHRSHLDYLLLSYCLYQEGQPPPHTAAGINLNFWPAGPILRRCGAFYIRRSFAGNRLYTVVFNEYVHYLLTKGHPVKFYVEGGRSRTGKILQPKTGMLAMVVHSYLRNSDRPIAIVPVYVGYDRVFEVGTYQNELRGKSKTKESAGLLFKARGIFGINFGKAYIGFAEPIYLKSHLDRFSPGWQQQKLTADTKPQWLHPFVAELANDVLTGVNANAVVSAQALFALVILSSPTRALAEEDIIYLMGRLMAAMRAAPYSRDVELPPGDAPTLLREALAVAKTERFQDPGGDVIHMQKQDAAKLSYYRNNVLHLVALPSLVASYFEHSECMAEDDLIAAGVALFPLLKSEFFLRWDAAEAANVFRGIIKALVREELLIQGEDGLLRRPDVTSRNLTALLFMARAISTLLERYATATLLLEPYANSDGVDRKAFESQCMLMSERMAILRGTSTPELLDSMPFKTTIDELLAHSYIEVGGNGQLLVGPRLTALVRHTRGLLSGDILQSFGRISR